MAERNITISDMTIEDIEKILVVENLCFTLPWTYESFYNEIKLNKFAYYHIIRVSDLVAGYSGMWQVLDEGHITNIAVLPDFRCQGLASMLLENLIDFCKSKEITSLTLEVRKSNIPARSLYRKFGFIEIGFRKQYYSDNHEDAIIMWKYDI